MSARSLRLRLLTLVFAVLQTAMPAALTLADAALNRDARDPTAHVEDVSTDTCQPPHGADCGVCRYLTTAMSAPPVAAVVDIPLAHPVAPTTADRITGVADRHGVNSRAPPALRV